ncbi:hypothetical protein RY831_11550 [Noviherbaspirillum sp. CPCC 100848]|uniref:Uncharacterized protein n=1 Tax=Noviherbaspirillum album TaxID=3080276 RepID=A0ABU6J849_9BURK|nr:hypothetical protein [Noviherbaspirillum sp. CPCC 100848]MEC4719786.1 hypothetical protein [Noviherbaspirillum sp. CPCC 100848]
MRFTAVLIMIAGLAGAAHAADDPAHAKTLIEQHKAIAAAHLAAAQCLASGKSEEACHQELNKTCKQLPIIGPLCGMRKHRH